MTTKDWNISKLQVLRQCHRKFYFAYETAMHTFTNPYRRKAYELLKMKTLKMWQGSIIDWMITKEILPAYVDRKIPDYEVIAKRGVDLAKRQFEFSKNRFYHANNISRLEVGADWAILDIHESLTPFQEIELIEIYATIEKVLIDFPTYESPVFGKSMEQYLLSARFLRPDAKQMKYEYGGVKVQPQIDLISYMGKSMHVIDWKVSERDDADYSRQLLLAGIVALGFSRQKYRQEKWLPLPTLKDVRLFEFNLLSGKHKEHVFNKDAVANALDTVYLLSDDQEELSQSKSWENLDINEYERTNKVSTCAVCNFKNLCKHVILNGLNYDEAKYLKLVQNQKLENFAV
ncbi:PD-(D/E)XK nuclease family protein [Dyadobacter bucti]|uniref:PD-(D/E)XK nuclease family protein n=1 Tax=Dyadobacter bucti TaxID=2572203 RepID=UPI001109D1FE|nr:PD-(D/E)XK nuclease family protein [Dyadobacter bucti]